jgi:RNA polymerase sigma factor (sigma-70 family)
MAIDHGSDSGSCETLVHRIANGEKKAEQELVETYWKSLFFIINKQAKDVQLAQDITQETFIVVITKARDGKIVNPNAISAFVRQVGINLLIAYYRKETRQKTDANEHIHLQFPDPSVGLSKKLGAQQLSTIVRQVLDELPTKRDKDVLYRYFVYGEQKQNICSELELSAEHFDRVLHRARTRLKQVLHIKLGADASKFNLSQFLLIAIAVNLPSHNLSMNTNNLFAALVRDLSEHHHSYSVAVKDRPSYTLDGKQYQQETRWQ